MSVQKCIIADGRPLMEAYHGKMHGFLRYFSSVREKDEAKIRALLDAIREATGYKIANNRDRLKRLQEGVCVYVGTSEDCLAVVKEHQAAVSDLGGNLTVDDAENHRAEVSAYKELYKEIMHREEKQAQTDAAQS